MSVQFKDYYQTLGVSKDASSDAIKKAFRDLARRTHPDKFQGADKAGAEAKFKEINEAYEVLRDPDKRRKYDTLGADWDQPRTRGQTGLENRDLRRARGRSRFGGILPRRGPGLCFLLPVPGSGCPAGCGTSGGSGR